MSGANNESGWKVGDLNAHPDFLNLLMDSDESDDSGNEVDPTELFCDEEMEDDYLDTLDAFQVEESEVVPPSSSVAGPSLSVRPSLSPSPAESRPPQASTPQASSPRLSTPQASSPRPSTPQASSPRAPSPVAPPFSPHTPALARSSSPPASPPPPTSAAAGSRRSRSRSRSPLRQVASAAEEQWVYLFDADGMPVEIQDGEQGLDSDFLMADAHGLYERDGIDDYVEDGVMADGVRMEVETSREHRSRGRGAGRRGRQRAGRVARGRGRGAVEGGRGGRGARGGRGGRGGRGARGGGNFKAGNPLQAVYATDDELPADVRQRLMDVVRRREMRLPEREREASRARSGGDTQGYEDGENDSEGENDTFYDANDGSGNPLLTGDDLHFEWHPMGGTSDTFRGEEEPFRVGRTGAVGSFSTAYEAFRSYWDDSILEHIVRETNLYATKIGSRAFQSKWVPTNAHEILCLLAFWMMLGIIRMPTIRSCFSTNPLLKTSIFRKILTQNRYDCLVRALHFVDADPSTTFGASTSVNGPDSLDRVYRLRPIIDHFNAKFQANYILDKDICIDESLTLWKGLLNIRQYIRTKAAKFGIKTFELCESVTGYLWSFIVYTGGCNNPDLPADSSCLKSSAVVRKLMTPLLNKGYRLFMDNWYNSPLLARFLKRNGTDCVGTLRSSRVDVPPVIHHAKLRQGQLVARHSGDVCVMTWQDKKRVSTISTCHGIDSGLSRVLSVNPIRTLPFKPQVVLDYNKFMGGVDSKDQMLEPYLLERKRCKKWYMKLFKRLINYSILNARILLASSTKKQQDHLDFRLRLVNEILEGHLQHIPIASRTVSKIVSSNPTRFVNSEHWLGHIEGGPGSRNKQSRCYVCYKNGKLNIKTTTRCTACLVPLCAVSCFKLYHTTNI